MDEATVVMECRGGPHDGLTLNCHPGATVQFPFMDHAPIWPFPTAEEEEDLRALEGHLGGRLRASLRWGLVIGPRESKVLEEMWKQAHHLRELCSVVGPAPRVRFHNYIPTDYLDRGGNTVRILLFEDVTHGCP